TQALKLCNGLFVSNRTVDQIYAQELTGMGEPMPAARVEIDSRRKTVVVGAGTDDLVPPMRAAYRDGIGCVVMAPDQSFADTDKLPLLEMAAMPGDASAMSWPDGDRVEKKKLAQGGNELALKRAGAWASDRAGHGGHRGQVTLSLLRLSRGGVVS